uniref:dihydroxy-acid dehydratase domain-containing protein n=1 Tax=Staphylococcus epidermidis TaxID=1282 RepID=UPI0037D9CCC3
MPLKLHQHSPPTPSPLTHPLHLPHQFHLQLPLHPHTLTLTTKSFTQNNQAKNIKNFQLIHPLQTPYDNQRALSLLFPNLPPKPPLIKLPPVDPSIKLFTQNPISFNSHHEPLQPIHNHTLTHGHVLLITYHRPNPRPA